MEPVWHVVKEVWQGERCVASEVISEYEEGDRASFRVAAAEARELQAEHDAEEEEESELTTTYSVSMW